MIDILSADPGAFIRHHRGEVLAALERVLDSGWYVLGTETATFEAEFARAFGLSHAIGVSNGTDALALALRALAVGPGSRVATVSHTAVATVAAIEMAGATPVFVDIDPVTYTMDPAALEAALAGPDPPHAAIVVHLYGHPADMLELLKISGRSGIPIIEDCAQAHGARIGERFVGGMSEASAFSFYPTKNLGAFGDGGLVAMADAEAAARVLMLRQYGWKQRYVSECRGVNSRLDEIQAAFLRVRLPFLDAANRRRAAIATAYDRGLCRTGLGLPTQRAGTTHVYHQYVVRHARRDRLQARLKERGIATNVHYPMPVHMQPAYRGRYPVGPGGLEVTEAAAREVLSLPMFPELDDGSVARVIDAVIESV